jgi:hypothetical protein
MELSFQETKTALLDHVPKDVVTHVCIPFLFSKCENCSKFLDQREMDFCENNKDYFRCDDCLYQLCFKTPSGKGPDYLSCDFKGKIEEFHVTRRENFPPERVQYYCTYHMNCFAHFQDEPKIGLCNLGKCDCAQDINLFLDGLRTMGRHKKCASYTASVIERKARKRRVKLTHRANPYYHRWDRLTC